jgi:hypothetical protein
MAEDRSRRNLLRRHRLLGNPFLAERGTGREDQRLDHDRHGARILQNLADVDVVELLEFETVDGHHGVRELHLFAQMNAQEPADVAVAGEHDRKTAENKFAKAGRNAA